MTLLLVALLGVSAIHFRERPPVPEPTRFWLSPPDQINIPLGSAFAVSPDGRHLAFAGAGSDKVTRLWIRSLSTLEARPLPGGDMSATPPPMFWSPDSRYVVFQDQGKLKKIDITGGPPQTLCDVTGYVVSGSWNRDGQIILGNNVAGKNGGALMRVPASGGECSPLTKLDGTERYHSFPSFLPDGRHFVYHRFSGPTTSGIYIGSIDVKPEEQSTQQLVATPNGGAYVPPSGSSPGQLLFVRDGILMAQPLDDRSLTIVGEAVPVAEQLGTFLNFAFFSVSMNGVLVYRAGGTQAVNQLTWLDPNGKTLGTVGEPGVYNFVALSPDSTRAAFSRADSDIWLMDLARGVSTRFTFGRGRSFSPVWSPDGTRIVFASDRDGGVFNLYQKPASGATEEELLLKSPLNKTPSSWSRDGRVLLYTVADAKTGNDVWMLPLTVDGKAGEPAPLIHTEFQEQAAQFSPDSRWVAYLSNESGRTEVFIRSFMPASAGATSDAGKWMVSQGGATSSPTWASGGRLMYLTPDFKLTAVDVVSGSLVQPGSPKTLFQWPGGVVATGSVGADGRILTPTPVGPGTPAPFTVVLNWPQAIRH